jgi:hypothetical protein
MGYWENTTYLRHGRIDEVVRALDAVFAREEMARVPAPPPRTRMLFEPMQYDRALDNDLWALAVFPGADGWSILKSAPLEILAERPAGASRMRLAEVCVALGASAFQVNIYDSTGVVLVEVSAAGDVLMSGFNAQSGDPMVWNGIELAEDRVEVAFELHDLAHLLPGADGDGDDFARAAAREIGGANAACADNLVCVDTLICHKPVAADGQALYYWWQGPSRQKHEPRASWRA